MPRVINDTVPTRRLTGRRLGLALRPRAHLGPAALTRPRRPPRDLTVVVPDKSKTDAVQPAVACSVISVNTGTEPNLPIPNLIGTEFSQEPIGTIFLRNRICLGTEEPNRSVR
jgi:hypothetical protein